MPCSPSPLKTPLRAAWVSLLSKHETICRA